MIKSVLNTKKGISIKEISKKLHLKEEDVMMYLQELEHTLQVRESSPRCYVKTEDKKHLVGKLQMTRRGYGFLVNGDKKILIRQNQLNGALDGDTILVQLNSSNCEKLKGTVIDKVRADQEHVGLVYEKDGKLYAKLDNLKFPFPVLLENMGGAYIDNKVLVRLGRKFDQDHYVGSVIRVLGHKNDPRVDVLSVMKELGIPDQFSKKVMEQVDKIPMTVSSQELEGRVDLRDEMIVTIDGDTAKDFDDAVSIKRLDNGNYELGVHIADVSHYVLEGDLIDKEAYKRGTSLYTPGYVTPMLASKLSNGICSLNPGVDRLTMTCKMEINTRGQILHTDIFESVIHSKKRMTYHNVNEVLDGNMVDGYEPFCEMLHTMLELSHILRKAKQKRGSINFDTKEIIIDTNERGKPIDIHQYERGEGERIIEDFMIAANEAVTTRMVELQLPFVYRIHEEPEEEKLNQFISNAKKLDLPVDITTNYGPIPAKVLQKQLEQYRGKENFEVLANLLLRSMKKACYSNSNMHHYALASRNYTHFTSPIRRYPDLMVHRALKEMLKGNANRSKFHAIEQKYKQMTEHASYCERRAESCEREVDKMKCAEYLEPFIGDCFEGDITWIDKKKIYVTLKNLISGAVLASSLEDYTYNDDTLCYETTNHAKCYQIGDHVQLKLIRSDKEKREIEFVMDTENQSKKKVKK